MSRYFIYSGAMLIRRWHRTVFLVAAPFFVVGSCMSSIFIGMSLQAAASVVEYREGRKPADSFVVLLSRAGSDGQARDVQAVTWGDLPTFRAANPEWTFHRRAGSGRVQTKHSRVTYRVAPTGREAVHVRVDWHAADGDRGMRYEYRLIDQQLAPVRSRVLYYFGYLFEQMPYALAVFALVSAILISVDKRLRCAMNQSGR